MFGFVLFIGVLLFFAWLDSGSSDSGNNSLSNSSRNNSSTSMTRQYSSTATTTYGRPVATMPATVVPTVEKPIHTGLKSDYDSFMQVLRENGIMYLYHFTDRRNLPRYASMVGCTPGHFAEVMESPFLMLAVIPLHVTTIAVTVCKTMFG